MKLKMKNRDYVKEYYEKQVMRIFFPWHLRLWWWLTGKSPILGGKTTETIQIESWKEEMEQLANNLAEAINNTVLSNSGCKIEFVDLKTK